MVIQLYITFFHLQICTDIDECAVAEASGFPLCQPGGGRCVNEPGGFRCECPIGHEVTEDGKSCKVEEMILQFECKVLRCISLCRTLTSAA